MNVICLILGIVCLLYYLVLICYAGITADFAWIWLVAAAVLEILAAGMYYGRRHPGFFPGWVRMAVSLLMLAGILTFCVLVTPVIRGMFQKPEAGLDYVVVLGAQVRGEKPSRALEKRLQKALSYAEENPDTILILSGGQGDGEEITEAECMRRYLAENGLEKQRLVLEERSVSTKENLLFSHELTGCAKKRTGILSNNFHVYRAMRLAGKQGYESVWGIPAKSDPIMQVHYVVREVFALVKEKIFGNI